MGTSLATSGDKSAETLLQAQGQCQRPCVTDHPATSTKFSCKLRGNLPRSPCTRKCRQRGWLHQVPSGPIQPCVCEFTQQGDLGRFLRVAVTLWRREGGQDRTADIEWLWTGDLTSLSCTVPSLKRVTMETVSTLLGYEGIFFKFSFCVYLCVYTKYAC